MAKPNNISEARKDAELEEEARRRQELYDRMPTNGNHLSAFRKELTGADPSPDGIARYSSFLPVGLPLTEERKQFIDHMQDIARQLRFQAAAAGGIPLRATCEVGLARHELDAWLFLFPPLDNGPALTAGQLLDALGEKGVVYGLDEALIASLGENPLYFTLLPVAKGQAALPGENGYLSSQIPMIQCDAVYPPGEEEEESEEGLYLDSRPAPPPAAEEDPASDEPPFIPPDFKAHQVREGDALCQALPPTEGSPGRTVTGKVLEARGGHAIRPLVGTNTRLGEDGVTLYASADGMASFVRGRFNVVQNTVIHGSVSREVGNVDVLGNLVIDGNVLDGMVVQATGHVTVRGMVEGAVVISGGKIKLEKGMNGNNRGSLTAQGDVSSKFLENAGITTHSSLYAESIINCTIVCDGNVEVTRGRGILVGGSLKVSGSMSANVIGSKSNRSTSIVLGFSPTAMEERSRLERELAQMDAELGELEKNVAMLERMGNLQGEYKELYNQLKLKLSVQRLRRNREGKKFEALSQNDDGIRSMVKVGTVYPLTQITIGRFSKTILECMNQCRIYLGPDGLEVGVK